jgi:hypothetical protein
MAARRLIILMVVLLALSTLAAALLPTPRTDDEDTTQEDTTQRESQPPGSRAAGPAVSGGGQLRQATIDTAPKPPQTVPAKVGDQLTLIVTSRFGDLVEIPAFGLFKAVAPAAPARFELLLDRAGVFAVRTVDSDLLAGRICATRLSPRAPRGRSRARACAPRDKRGRAGSARSAPQP